MRSKSGFFKTNVRAGAPLYQTVSKPEPSFVDVGGTGDCGFRGAAAAILSNIGDEPARDNQVLAKYILEIHASYFSQQPIFDRLMTPVEHLSKLVEAPHNRAKFVLELSYALRQVTVDELCRFPDKYPGAFVSDNEKTDPANMRKRDTWIDESAIAALSNVTKIPITVQVVEPGKELHLSLNYNEELKDAIGSPITLQLQNKHYLPLVSNPEQFALLNPNKVIISTHRVQAAEPINPPPKDPELSEILAIIEQADKDLIKEYEETLKRLELMVNLGEFGDSPNDVLMKIYIAGMNKSDYLAGRVKQVGIEHGNQDFFQKAIDRAQKGVEPVSLPKGDFDDQITKELVRAIARAISIGHLTHSVYENLEQTRSFKVS
ncbi:MULTISPECIES: OTU domain-containing protein [Legionella]|uniref:Uncharacterized protein n=1 Tax=Legionella drozanskii LLAP-1 TaxID=1212489 RepID=A0A0W0SN07_9GAMM|nr:MULTISPECIES: OTU domain-containing protein [Legionella]KTC84617.1 hypothetical protein Ldro_2781 [Legionella drozanskii LLAP-1]PJE07696.1 MAG: hypothetical protein CK430_13470 [Legionella sp.]